MSCKIKMYFCHISDSSAKKSYKILEVFFGGFLAPHLASDVVLFMSKLGFFKNRCTKF